MMTISFPYVSATSSSPRRTLITGQAFSDTVDTTVPLRRDLDARRSSTLAAGTTGFASTFDAAGRPVLQSSAFRCGRSSRRRNLFRFRCGRSSRRRNLYFAGAGAGAGFISTLGAGGAAGTGQEQERMLLHFLFRQCGRHCFRRFFFSSTFGAGTDAGTGVIIGVTA